MHDEKDWNTVFRMAYFEMGTNELDKRLDADPCFFAIPTTRIQRQLILKQIHR